jgi:hypothetical protein
MHSVPVSIQHEPDQSKNIGVYELSIEILIRKAFIISWNLEVEHRSI